MLNFTSSQATKATQATVILNALQQGPLTTQAIRVHLNIMHPAGRVKDLRRMGYTIATQKITQRDVAGNLHTQALYSLETDDSEGGHCD